MRGSAPLGVMLAFLAAQPPTRLSAQCPNGSPPPCAGARATTVPASVAVLYFENLSRDTADLYLADGLTEELTSKLGAVTRLRVTGRSVVRNAQRNAGGDAMAVGRALNVRYLVEGSLRRAGSRVRISARLLRASDGVRIWGDDYDRTMDDLLALQEDIAREVAGNVAGQLLPDERRAIARRPTASAEAYDHYLRGKYLLPRRTESAVTQAVAEFDHALRFDPGFGAAEAARASALMIAYGYGVPVASPDTIAAWAQRSALRAIQLAPEASDTWTAMGLVRLWFAPRDFDQSRAALERATSLNPRDADALHTLGTLFTALPDLRAATAALRRAIALDPGRGITLLNLAQIEFISRRLPVALRLVDSAVAVDPGQARIYSLRAALRLRTGDTTGARADAETGVRLATGTIKALALAALIEVDVARGDTAAARAQMAEVERARPLAIGRAMARLALGERDAALALLEQGRLDPLDRNWLSWPQFDPIRASPRFAAAVSKWAPRGARPLW